MGRAAAGLSQVLSMRQVNALVTASDLLSSRKIPRVPVVPEVVATLYRPRNLVPTRDGSPMNSCVPERVTSGSVTHSSKWVIRTDFPVTGSNAGSVTSSGMPW